MLKVNIDGDFVMVVDVVEVLCLMEIGVDILKRRFGL